MKKQYENNIKKGGIAEEIAMLKQRREARKAKEEQKKNPQSNQQNTKECDAAFAKMMIKKKKQFQKISLQSILIQKIPKFLLLLEKDQFFKKN